MFQWIYTYTNTSALKFNFIIQQHLLESKLSLGVLQRRTHDVSAWPIGNMNATFPTWMGFAIYGSAD